MFHDALHPDYVWGKVRFVIDSISSVGKTPETAPTVLATNGFATLGLDSRILDSLVAMGYTEPTPIQKEAIPPLLAGRDIIGIAATGTGKTAAFALPILTRIAASTDRKKPSAIIVVPTRELAIQVASAVAKYGKPMNIKVVPVYGGAGFGEQIRALTRGVDIVVATPGRALDHVRRGTLPLDGITSVVLDEADEMLDMGFAEDIESILSATPKTRQTALFSATMPPRIAQIAERHLTKPVRITVAKAQTPAGEAAKVRQVVYTVSREHKIAALARIIQFEAPASAIIFCRTRDESDGIADALTARGNKPESLHGGLSQEQRDRVMRKFRDGAIQLLVATDVAARGLDIRQLSHVINFGVPIQAEAYVHRIGRVGRAGREGVAITVSEPWERRQIQSIERMVGQKLLAGRIPTAADLRGKRVERIRENLVEILKSGTLDEYRPALKALTAEYPAEQVALAALALAAKGDKNADDDRDIPAPLSRPEPAKAPARRPSMGLNSSSSPSINPAPSRPARPGMTRVYVGAGRQDNIGRREIIAAIEHEVGLNLRDLGAIDVTERFSIVEVPGEIADDVIERLDGVRMRGRRIPVRRDRIAGAPAV